MNYTELFIVISKPWANVNDIKKIASCGRDNATKIRNEIIEIIVSENKILPTSKEIIVPMEYVVKYLSLDIDYITRMAKSEKLINS